MARLRQAVRHLLGIDERLDLGTMQTTTRDPLWPADTLTPPDHLTPVLGRYFERTWSHGDGHRLYDIEGRGYLDFANGIAVSSLGHHHPAVTAAIHAQVDRLIAPPSAIGYAEPINRLAEMIAAEMPDPLDTVFFLNSGSEAIEGALKMARRVTGRPGIIAFRGGFHGRTFGATSVTSSNPNYRQGYEPLLPGVHLCAFPDVYRDFAGDAEAATDACLATLEAAFEGEIVPEGVAAILIEPIQGEGGYRPAPARFLQELRRLADRHGILLIADEVQSGFARTGKMWGFEHAGIVPDVVTLAKALGGGVPIGAMGTTDRIAAAFTPGSHGTTFGGNPLACAAAVAAVRAIAEPAMLEHARDMGHHLERQLAGLAARHRRIQQVRGLGLMWGLVLDGPGADIVLRCLEAGLLINCTADRVLRLTPPLVVTRAELDEGLAVLDQALGGAAR